MKFENVAKFLLCFLIIAALLSCGTPGPDASKNDTGTGKTTGKKKKKGKTVELQLPKTLTEEQQKEFLKSVAGKRLGLIDAGSKRQTPPQILDLATAFLSEKRNIQLVERSDLDEILKEQALQLSMHTENDPEKMVRLGKLVKADALLMFETGEDSGAYTPLRLRLVGTQSGNKVWDDTIFVKKNLTSLEADVNVIIDRAISRLQALDSGRNKPVIIGISQIRGTGFKGQLEWLGTEIAAGMERNLANRAGVLLVERHKLRPLVEERYLDPGPAENLQTATVLVEGTYRVDHDAGENTIKLSLRFRTHDDKASNLEITGQTGEIAKLCRQAADALLAKLAMPFSAHPPMHPEKEAMFLVNQAQIFLSLSQPDRAIPPLQSALALAPRLLKPKLLFLKCLLRLPQMRSFTYWRRDVPMEKRRQYFRYYFSLSMQGLETARKMLENPDFPKTQNRRSKNFDRDFARGAFIWQLNHRDGVFGYPSTLLRICDCPETREAIQIMAPAYRNLFRVYLEITDNKVKAGSFLEDCLEDGLHAGRYWFAQPGQVLEHIWGLVEKAVETGNLLPLKFKCLQSPLWPWDKKLHRQYLGFLARLSKHQNPVVRALAERSYALYYFRESPVPDHEKGLSHYRGFVRLLEKEVLPRFLNSRCNVGLWADINLFSTPVFVLQSRPGFEDKLKGYDIPSIAGVKRRAMEAFLMPGSNKIGWRLLMDDAAAWSEHAGQIKEMLDLLKRCRKHLDVVKMGPHSTFRYHKSEFKSGVDKIIRRLLKRRPDLAEAGDKTAVTSTVSKVLLEAGAIPKAPGPVEDRPGVMNMVGMIRSENHLAVICVEGNGYSPWGRGHTGILRLEPGSMKVLDYTGVSGLDYTTNRRYNSFNLHSDHGPRRCSWKDEVFLGLFDSGIIRFPYKGKPVHLTEGNGLVSQDIYRSMTVLNGKLYALVRETSKKEGLMEVDLDTGRSRILISSHGSDDTGDLHRMWLQSMMTEPGQPYLLIHAIAWNQQPYRRHWGIYRYNPETRKAKWVNTFLPGQYARLGLQGPQILVTDLTKVGILPAVGRGIKWFYLMKRACLHRPRRKPGVYKFLCKPSVKWRDDGEIMKCVLTEDRLLIQACEDSGKIPTQRRGPYRLLLFKKGKKKPLEIKGEGIPTAEKIVDMMRLDDRALVLTHDRLYSLSLE